MQPQVPPEHVREQDGVPAAVPADAWQGRVYRLLQFTHLPTKAQKARLRQVGVQLFDYLPLNAYTASLSYTNYFGGDFNTNVDRDYVALSFGVNF